jgi:hypothetical protein
MAQPSRHGLLVHEAWEQLFVFRARIGALEMGIHRSVSGTVDCILASRKLMADLDDQIRKVNGS